MSQNNLTSNSQLNILESKLKKQSYFSNRQLPNSLDAKIFLGLKESNTNRKTTPNLYHWYVMMKQFSPDIFKKWIATADQDYEEDLCLKNLRIFAQNLKVSEKTGDDTSSQGQKKKISQIIEESALQDQLTKYIMVVKIKKDSKIPTYKHKHKFLREKEVTITKFEPFIFSDSKEIFIQFNSTAKQCQNFKNQISYWSQVEGIQIKKGKKVTIRHHTL